ncbi:radical SAM protein [Streptomyces sp. R08]|uniref:Radical SAM protein n=1 Tax=Streptomyces sp. R08 TaxID=3238624 RepID=A0AB39MMA0_9ACTN
MPVPVNLSTPASSRPRTDLRIWLADLTYTQQSISSEIMPQAIGGIATYLGTQVDMTHRVRIFKYPEKLADELAKGPTPDIIGFSCYVWNINLSLAFAERIKEALPHIITVFGGPNYPAHEGEQEEFLRTRLGRSVDFYVDREGEQAFAGLVGALVRSDGDLAPVHGTVAGVHSIDAAGRAHLPAAGPRLASLASVPSPYRAGLMDEFFDGRLVPTVQTNRGCPFSCSFCVEGTRYYSKIAKKTAERVRQELLYIGARMAALIDRDGCRNELLITDSNFGMFPEDLDICDAIVECQDTYGWPRYIDLTTGKNKRDRVLEAISRTRGTMTLSGSVQSLNPEVLAQVRRSNIDAGQLMDVALAAAEQGTGTYSEVILGLPGDSKEAHFSTLDQLIAARFDRLNMFQLTLLPGSDLWSPDQRSEHSMRTRFRVIPRSFGEFEVLGRRLAAAEIDEVCVELPTLSFDDYVDCRQMNLFISAAYNDGTFELLTKLLRTQHCSVFRWLQILQEPPKQGVLSDVVRGFRDETRDQLWDSADELGAYAQEHIKDYISGKLGSNLLYTYRALMLSTAFDGLAAEAGRAARQTLAEAGRLTPPIDEFITEAQEYHRLQLSGVLGTNVVEPLRQEARFDLAAFLDAPMDSAPVPLSAPTVRSFELSETQLDVLKTYREQFGDSPQGVGRMLTKVRFQDLRRVATIGTESS